MSAVVFGIDIAASMKKTTPSRTSRMMVPLSAGLKSQLLLEGGLTCRGQDLSKHLSDCSAWSHGAFEDPDDDTRQCESLFTHSFAYRSKNVRIIVGSIWSSHELISLGRYRVASHSHLYYTCNRPS